MIKFKIEEGIFNFRVAGILINNNKVLIHKLINDEFYASPGGRVEMFESTESTIIREMKEELGIDVSINRLLWICEQTFDMYNSKYHELSFYYLIECNDRRLLNKGDIFYITEGKNEFEFKWVNIANIKEEEVYPKFAKDNINNLPTSIERIVDIN